MKVITCKYKLEKWKAIITNQMASGLTAAEYCRQEDLPISTFFYWKRMNIPMCLGIFRSTEGFYGNWYHPDDLQQKFNKISDYCREQGIELVFVFPPTHIDLQERVADFCLTEDYRNYKQEIRQLGWKVYDFDVPNELTVV